LSHRHLRDEGAEAVPFPQTPHCHDGEDRIHPQAMDDRRRKAAGWRKADEQLDTPAEMGFAEATEHPLAEIRSVAIPACVEQCSHGSH
jgi:hypothetical protein